MATRAARYPEATDGLIELVGVSVVKQLDEDCVKAGMMQELSSVAAAEKRIGDILVGLNENLFGKRRWLKERCLENVLSWKRKKSPEHILVQSSKTSMLLPIRAAGWQMRVFHEYEVPYLQPGQRLD